MQSFIQRVYAQDCNLNNNGVIPPETICAAAECPTFPLLRKGLPSLYYGKRIQVWKKINVKLLCT